MILNFLLSFLLAVQKIPRVVSFKTSNLPRTKTTGLSATIPSWSDLSSLPNFNFEQPMAVDGKYYSSRPTTSKPTLYRERHGWCPYSERIWLALEAKGIDYDTVYIDNIYGRPSWYSGDTPQMKWEDGKTQSESMDLVQQVDKRFDGTITLYPDDIANEVINKARAFRDIFPKRSRPSSRAAFLFRFDGEPLWKNEFEKVLQDTDSFLAKTASGPFLCGEHFTAADIAWAPFLERYAGQLPCLHDGLNPKCEDSYPNLSAWYKAMETVPEYACRVKGDSSSWRKVLTMAGYGNAGLPPTVSSRMDDQAAEESAPLDIEEAEHQASIWEKYASSRPHAASTPGQEAASVLIRNREMIIQDTVKRIGTKGNKFDLPPDEKLLDASLRCMACILCGDRYDGDILEECNSNENVTTLAAFLDHRMCVPRDMGAMPAAYFKRLSAGNL